MQSPPNLWHPNFCKIYSYWRVSWRCPYKGAHLQWGATRTGFARHDQEVHHWRILRKGIECNGSSVFEVITWAQERGVLVAAAKIRSFWRHIMREPHWRYGSTLRFGIVEDGIRLWLPQLFLGCQLGVGREENKFLFLWSGHGYSGSNWEYESTLVPQHTEVIDQVMSSSWVSVYSNST